MVQDFKLSEFAGDYPNVTLTEAHLEKIIFDAQQTDRRICNRMMQKSLPVGTKRLMIPISEKIDGTTGRRDTMSSGIVSAVMGTTGAEIVSASRDGTITDSARYDFTQNQALSTKKRQLTSVTYRFDPFTPKVDAMSNWVNIMEMIQVNADARWNRYRDSVAKTALGADATDYQDDVETGAESGTPVPFPTANIINADGQAEASGDLLEEAIFTFENLDVDIQLERPIFLCGPMEKKQLREKEHLINNDYATGRPLDGNQLPSALGFDVVVSTGLDVSGGIRTCFAFLPSGMLFAEWQDMDVTMSIRHDRQDGVQLAMVHESGCIRVDDSKVLKIFCNEN